MVERPPPEISPETLFRFHIVSSVRAYEHAGGRRSDAVREIAGRIHDFEGRARTVSRRTIWRWLKAYEADGLAGLQPRQRARLRGSRVLPERLLTFIEDEKLRDRDASIPELLRRAAQREVISRGDLEAIDRTTVWRAMKRLGIETRVRKVPALEASARRFEHSARMQMVLVDFKHFRAGPKRLRRAAIYFLDDATRFGLDVLVTTSGESAEVVLRALHEVLRVHGRMDALYVDNGPGFVADDFVAVCAELDIHCIWGTAGYPQGHGKVERFNRSAKARVLRGLVGADVDPGLGPLTLRLRHDLDIYNHLPHQGLGGKDTPYDRWSKSPRPLRPIGSAKLDDGFRVSLERSVSNDHVVQVDGVEWEVPRGLAGERIKVWRHLLEKRPDADGVLRDALYIDHCARYLRLQPVDKRANAARAPRARRKAAATDEFGPHSFKSASTLSFERHLAPIVDADGGFRDDSDEQEE